MQREKRLYAITHTMKRDDYARDTILADLIYGSQSEAIDAMRVAISKRVYEVGWRECDGGVSGACQILGVDDSDPLWGELMDEAWDTADYEDLVRIFNELPYFQDEEMQFSIYHGKLPKTDN